MVWPNYQDFYNPLITKPQFMSWDDLLLGPTHDAGMNLFTKFQKINAHICGTNPSNSWWFPNFESGNIR